MYSHVFTPIWKKTRNTYSSTEPKVSVLSTQLADSLSTAWGQPDVRGPQIDERLSKLFIVSEFILHWDSPQGLARSSLNRAVVWEHVVRLCLQRQVFFQFNSFYLPSSDHILSLSISQSSHYCRVSNISVYYKSILWIHVKLCIFCIFM